MKIAIFTLGSRGDVEPWIALALGLQRSGHRVTLAAPQVYGDWIRSYGIDAYPVRFDMEEFFRTAQLGALLRRGQVLRALRTFRQGLAAGSALALDDFLEASRDADFIMQCGVAHGGIEIAQQRNIPMTFSYLAPFTPTRAFPAFFFPLRFSLGGAWNLLTYRLVMRDMWSTYGGALDQWRERRFGLPPWRSYAKMFNARPDAPWLYCFSPHVISKPPEWQDRHHLTGYWFLPMRDDWQAPADLLRFLDQGPPPVYVGFGSMHNHSADPARLTREVLDGLRQSGRRGIIFTGGGGALQRLPAPPEIFFLERAPHAWLFPRVAAVVHHGGAGTTAAGLRAGVPAVIAPMVIDQHGWAQRIEQLGVGVHAGKMLRLTARKLACALNTVVNDPELRARAAVLGGQIRAEDGVARAVEVIERYAEDFDRASAARS